MSEPIDLGCPKCGGSRATTSTRYVEASNYLDCICTICGHKWKMSPADYNTTPPIPEGDSDVI